jgi:hypothetical protein
LIAIEIFSMAPEITWGGRPQQSGEFAPDAR